MHGKRLPVSMIGEMRTKVSTVTPVTRGTKTKLHRGVETMLLTNVLVVPDMKCNLFSCASAFKNDGIKTLLNDDRHLVLPSGARVVFAKMKKHYSIDVNAQSDESACVVASDSTVHADFACAATGDDAELLHERLGHFSKARINSALGTNMLSNFSKIRHDPKSC